MTAQVQSEDGQTSVPPVLFFILGDSLSHGTMDATNSVSQLSAANWLIRDGVPIVGIEKAIGMLWDGNNDSSTAALGTGGRNPMFQPMPFDEINGKPTT
jgi:hypothetical protein